MTFKYGFYLEYKRRLRLPLNFDRAAYGVSINNDTNYMQNHGLVFFNVLDLDGMV